MSGLLLTTGLCQGWSNPNMNYATPVISYLSGTYSPAGSTTLVAIFGSNFRLFSTIKFGTYTPTMIFINSGQINFYVPSSAPPGNNPVQVFNDTNGSNTVEYTIDIAQGFWYLDPTYSNVITNSNSGGLSVEGPIQINNTIDSNSGSTVVGNLVFNNAADISKLQYIQWSNTGSNITSNNVSGIPTVLINGDLNVSGNVYANNVMLTSDYRIKDIIESLDDSDSYSVDDLNPVKYFNKKSGKEEIGFIAHEVQEVFPCLVTGEKDGPGLQTLNYIGLIGILTKEIQLLKAEVATLKGKGTAVPL
jgi:hypothetical protein